MDRRVDVAEGPFIRRDLSVRMHVPFAEHEDQLFLGKGRIDQSQRNAVECEVPGGIPRILPFVRHRDDVGVVEMRPIRVATMEPLPGWFGPGRVALQPPKDFVMVELLSPEETGKRLPLDAACVFGEIVWRELVVELVRLLNPLCERRSETLARETRLAVFVRQAKM